jgi:hypothetical protein
MQTAAFYGSSDDLIEVEGVKGGDEFGAYSGAGILHGMFNVGGKMRVYAIYDGCWMFAVGQVAEDIALPDWPVRIKQQHEYSTRLEIDVPDDVMVFREALS